MGQSRPLAPSHFSPVGQGNNLARLFILIDSDSLSKMFNRAKFDRDRWGNMVEAVASGGHSYIKVVPPACPFVLPVVQWIRPA